MSVKKFVETELIKRFGRIDIIEYLSVPKIGPNDRDDPKWLKTWGKTATHLFTSEALYETYKFEEVVLPYLSEPWSWFGHINNFWNDYQKLNPKSSIHQCGSNTWMIRYLDPFGVYKYVVLGESPTTIQPAKVIKYLVEWRNQFKLKRKGGWVWLLRKLDQSVRQAKECAERDYRNACAVSSDGLSIILAGVVFVVRGNGTVDKYISSEFFGGSSAFAEERINKPKSGNHRIMCGGDKDAQKAMRDVASGFYESVFLEPSEKKGLSGFVVKELYVPRSVLSTKPQTTINLAA
mgnify:CR=1 FL=1